MDAGSQDLVCLGNRGNLQLFGCEVGLHLKLPKQVFWVKFGL
jgi:hypothetical protein